MLFVEILYRISILGGLGGWTYLKGLALPQSKHKFKGAFGQSILLNSVYQPPPRPHPAAHASRKLVFGNMGR